MSEWKWKTAEKADSKAIPNTSRFSLNKKKTFLFLSSAQKSHCKIESLASCFIFITFLLYNFCAVSVNF
jgi:hypothetical protein